MLNEAFPHENASSFRCAINEGMINKTIDTIVRWLQEWHPMNRCIRNENWEVSAYLIVKDIEGSKDHKHAYIEYLFSDGKEIKNIKQEIDKFITRARKLGYRKIVFNCIHDRLNNFLKRDYASKRIWEDEYEIDLYIETTKAIKYLETDENAAKIWKNLSKEEKQHIENLLITADKQKQDLQVFRIYWAIQNIQNSDYTLWEISPLKSLYTISQDINTENNKKQTIEQYTKDFLIFLADENGIEYSCEQQDRYKQELESLIAENWTWGMAPAIKKWLSDNNIKLNSKFINIPINTTFLAWLNSLESTRHIWVLDSTQFPYEIISLQNKAEMVRESSQLWHCVWDSDYYMEKVKNKEILVLSLRDTSGKSYWTIEYNIKKKSIVQFKWWGDVSVNSLPENQELVFVTLDTLLHSGYPVESISEEFDYSIVFSEEGKRYTSCNDEDLRDTCKRKNMKVLKWGLILDGSYTEDEVLHLCTISGLKLDMTHLPWSIKNKIERIEWSILENCSQCFYKKLEYVWWDFDAEMADSFSAPKLKYVRGKLDASDSIGFSSPKLEYVGEDLYAWNTSSFLVPELQHVGGYLDARRATSFPAPELQHVGGYLDAENVTSFSTPKLQHVGGYLYAWNTSSFLVPELQHVGAELYANNADSFSAPELQHVGEILYINKITSFSAPELQYVGGSLDAKNVTSFLVNSDIIIEGESLQEYSERLYNMYLKTLENTKNDEQ